MTIPVDISNIPPEELTTASCENIDTLTQSKLRRCKKCHCSLPYTEKFKKHYLFYNKYDGAQAWKKIGGNIDATYGEFGTSGLSNSCAARVSYGLNYSGKIIPRNAPSANMNFADNKRYIISAREMNKYLRQVAGKPDYTLTKPDDFYKLKSVLTHDDVFIMSSEGHASVVTMNYEDPYASDYLGDVWFLPTKICSCG